VPILPKRRSLQVESKGRHQSRSSGSDSPEKIFAGKKILTDAMRRTAQERNSRENQVRQTMKTMGLSGVAFGRIAGPNEKGKSKKKKRSKGKGEHTDEAKEHRDRAMPLNESGEKTKVNSNR